MKILKKTRFVWLMEDENGYIVNFMPSLVWGLIIGNALMVAICIMLFIL